VVHSFIVGCSPILIYIPASTVHISEPINTNLEKACETKCRILFFIFALHNLLPKDIGNQFDSSEKKMKWYFHGVVFGCSVIEVGRSCLTLSWEAGI
jgi:hypothetical protein